MTRYIVEFSREPSQRQGTHLVVLLHGYGSHEGDLLGITPYLPQQGVTYASLRAPQPVGHILEAEAKTAYVDSQSSGYQWWPLNQQLETGNFRSVELAVDYLLGWLEPLAQSYRSLSLLGFSQGMAVATSVARRRPGLVRAVVGLSGFAVRGEGDFFRDDLLTGKNRLPLFWGRGQADPVITAEKITATREWAADHARLSSHLYPGLTHSLSALELEQVSDYLSQELALDHL